MCYRENVFHDIESTNFKQLQAKKKMSTAFTLIISYKEFREKEKVIAYLFPGVYSYNLLENTVV